jgi:flagellar M-ring protein FliF
MAEAIALNPQASLLLVLRQAGVLIGVAAAVALGLYVALWARTPEFAVLYTDLAERDIGAVVDALAAQKIPYRMDVGAGTILVAANRLDEARLELAGAGLPRSGGLGFDMLNKDEPFGASQFLEQARYQHVIEGELSRSIAHINNVRAARVHLAVPKQSAFARTRRDPTASVIVDLYNGRQLEAHQVSAIVHMVSASVAGMRASDVTVIDQHGNLLTDSHSGADELVISAKRFDYTRKLEQSYIERVEAILAPLVGADGVRAQVTADIDFTANEQTRESFNPDLPAVRSESTLQEERAGDSAVGIPGALSNQPTVAASAPETPAAAATDTPADAVPPASTSVTAAAPSTKRNQATRNYELDRTISHTRSAVGSVRRLSIAVVVRAPAAAPVAADEAQAGDAKTDPGAAPAAATGEEQVEDAAAGSAAAKPGFSDEELARMTALVKEAIGFDAARGDSVSITSAEFLAPPAPEPLPAPALWQQPWVWSVGKQVLGGLFVLFLVFGLIRPTIKSLMARPGTLAGSVVGNAEALERGAPGTELAALPGGKTALAQAGVGAQPAFPSSSSAMPRQSSGPLLVSSDIDPNIDTVKQFVNNDPRVAAQVIKGWVGE